MFHRVNGISRPKTSINKTPSSHQSSCQWIYNFSQYSYLTELLGCESTSCYHFLSNNRTWNESRSECIKFGGDLAVIDNHITHDFVSGKLFELLRNGNTTASEVWLGAKAVELDKWYWEDDSELGNQRYFYKYEHNLSAMS